MPYEMAVASSQAWFVQPGASTSVGAVTSFSPYILMLPDANPGRELCTGLLPTCQVAFTWLGGLSCRAAHLPYSDSLERNVFSRERFELVFDCPT